MNCHVPKLQAACTDLFSSAMLSDTTVIMQLLKSAAASGIIRQLFTACSRGIQEQLISTLDFVYAMAKNAAESSDTEKIGIIGLVLESGVVEKLVNILVSCPSSIKDSDTVQIKCALCLVSLLQFTLIQDLLVSIKGGFSALFSVFTINNETLLSTLLGVFMATLTQPAIAEFYVANGLLVSLPNLVIHQSVVIQSLAQKIIVSLLKTLSNKVVLRNQTLTSALQRISTTSRNDAVRSTAAKLLNILNSL